jgi:hypothetical protein
LSLCFNWAPHHEGVLGEWRCSATHYWPRHYTGVASFTPRPLYPQGKHPWYPLYRKLGGPQTRSGRGSQEKNSQLLPGIEPPIIQPVFQCYTTELTWQGDFHYSRFSDATSRGITLLFNSRPTFSSTMYLAVPFTWRREWRQLVEHHLYQIYVRQWAAVFNNCGALYHWNVVYKGHLHKVNWFEVAMQWLSVACQRVKIMFVAFFKFCKYLAR